LISKAADGFYHPKSEAELIALVQGARQNGVQLRVRGAAHSVSYAVYTNPAPGVPDVVSQQTPPPGSAMNVMLDLYRDVVAFDKTTGVITAEAGIHLGPDPLDPTGTATLETSLLYKLQQAGFCLDDLGGITHQTVSGFLSTGSSGGSIKYGIESNIVGFRIIDGTGTPFDVRRDDPDPSKFWAALVSMGALGVISTVTLRAVPTFNIVGQEAITTIADCKVDLFGPGSATQPSLEQFLAQTDYTRLYWWPQRGAERVVVWQANRVAATPGFQPKEYEEFGEAPLVEELLIAIFYTIVGNLGDLGVGKQKLKVAFDRAREIAAQQATGESPLSEDGITRIGAIFQAFVAELPVVGKAIEKIIEGIEDLTIDALEFVVFAAVDLITPFASGIQKAMPQIMKAVIPIFVSLDSEKSGAQKGQPQHFQDYSYRGLPMDNQADDILVGTGFTEIWVPLSRTRQVMCLLRDYIAQAPTDAEALSRSGIYTWELYASKPNSGWMSMSYSNGNDEWKDGVFRVDVFWYATFAGNPVSDFYEQFWQLLRKNGVPFRLHWGKYQPNAAGGDPEEWTPFFRSQYEKWDQFLALRAQKDPGNVFLTDYWRQRLGV